MALLDYITSPVKTLTGGTLGEQLRAAGELLGIGGNKTQPSPSQPQRGLLGNVLSTLGSAVSGIAQKLGLVKVAMAPGQLPQTREILQDIKQQQRAIEQAGQQIETSLQRAKETLASAPYYSAVTAPKPPQPQAAPAPRYEPLYFGPAITPPRGASGAQGTQQQSFSYLGGGISTTGQTGSMGLGGMSARTGLLGGTTSGLSYLVPPTQEEQEKNEIEIKNKVEKAFPGSQLLRNELGDYYVIDQFGHVKTAEDVAQGAGFVQPRLRMGIGRVSGEPAVTPEGVIDIARLKIGEITEAMKSPLSKQTAADFQRQLTELADKLAEQYRALGGVPDNPMPRPELIVDNQYQLNKLAAKPLEVYEEVMYKWDIPRRIKEIEDIRAKIIAESQAYDAMIKDIRDDPDFPKKLAERRIAAIENARNVNLKAMQLQHDFLVENYNLALQQAKMQLGLYESEYEAEQRRQEQQRDNNRQLIQQMISTGALGSLTDEEIRHWAESGGYTYDSLKEVAKAVRTGNEIKIQKALQQIETKEQKSAIQAYLANQGLPLTIVDSSGELTDSALNKVVSNGVPLDIAMGIWANMKAGNPFDVIRAGMRAEGIDPVYLDKFVTALQGRAGEQPLVNPFR